ncbi:hypothetical protein HMPREF9943_01565 [Eggerthia catenaformis OT 569 = DSM 20559]|uniref:Uncharacterized protein n=2 Tax=Eggerthia catenaformis TaxID=31973 RepID=M2P794_9FIRM|nr:hypothetical protein HMPREF9943_01565 [Eggerthia catenaformis OT 569 = DSM 20559]
MRMDIVITLIEKIIFLREIDVPIESIKMEDKTVIIGTKTNVRDYLKRLPICFLYSLLIDVPLILYASLIKYFHKYLIAEI